MSAATKNRRTAVILGAARFKKTPSLDRASFSSSAQDFVSYLLDKHLFALPEPALLNLFDSHLPPGDQLEQICDFLDAFRGGADDEGGDIILYYVGHGGFVGMNKEYFLAVATTKDGFEGSTAIRIGDLSSALRDHAGKARKYLILDCCFAASAFAEFQDSGLSAVISSQTLEPLPPKGTALLCSSGSRQVSLSPSSESHTLFSGALMAVLRIGERSGLKAFSLDDVGRRVKDLLRSRCPQEWIRPEVHSPDMREGNVAHIPIFPNPGFDPVQAMILNPGQADYVRNLEFLVATRDGQLEHAMSSLDSHLDMAMQAVADVINLRGPELKAANRRAKELLNSRFALGWTETALPPEDSVQRAFASAPALLAPRKTTADQSVVSEREDVNLVRRLECLLEARTDQLQQAVADLERSYDITLQALGDALDLKDAETPGHSRRVTAFTIAIARAMHVPREQILMIARGAFLHDVGKMAVPDSILRKPGKLNDVERGVMREHCIHGYQMLKKIPFLAEACDIVYSHQENFDGSGYPRGLKGKEIPLGARIFSVADALDAITTDRPYRAAQPLQTARDKIRDGVGTFYDPDVVRVFLEMPGDIFEDLAREIDAQSYPFSMNPKGPGGARVVDSKDATSYLQAAPDASKEE
jgi:putative nucleotidyltransferase with HDIG domain